MFYFQLDHFDFFDSNDHRVVILEVLGAATGAGRVNAGSGIDFHRLLDELVAVDDADDDVRRFQRRQMRRRRPR